MCYAIYEKMIYLTNYNNSNLICFRISEICYVYASNIGHHTITHYQSPDAATKLNIWERGRNRSGIAAKTVRPTASYAETRRREPEPETSEGQLTTVLHYRQPELMIPP